MGQVREREQAGQRGTSTRTVQDQAGQLRTVQDGKGSCRTAVGLDGIAEERAGGLRIRQDGPGLGRTGTGTLFFVLFVYFVQPGTS